MMQGDEPHIPQYHQHPSSVTKAFLTKAPLSSNPGSSPAEARDLSQQSQGATAILWFHSTGTSMEQQPTVRGSASCLARGLTLNGSSESWEDMTHIETLPGV